ncbi:MAG: RNA polymerase sigma factor [Planctomycetota bacterium]
MTLEPEAAAPDPAEGDGSRRADADVPLLPADVSAGADAAAIPHGPGPDSLQWGALLSRFGHGSDSALAELVDREAPRVLRRIAAAIPGHLRARVGASDIFQQTLMDLVRVQQRFDNRGPAAFRKLMDTMAEARVARAIRRERAVKRDVLREIRPQPRPGASSERPDLDALSGSAATPSQVVGSRESADRLQRALAQLPAADREILDLIDYQEVGFEEAAVRLHLNVKAAQKRHSRALQRLRTLLRSRPDRTQP